MDILRSAISLRQLHYLVAVADAGSFSAAAQHIHVTQPALSRQVAQLETQVGSRLLTRTRNGVTLTDAGARLCELARGMLERLGSVEAELRIGDRVPAGVVTVALPMSVAALLAPRVLRELAADYPRITLRIEDGSSFEQERSLEAATVDFGIVAAAEDLVDVEYEPLLRESLLLVEQNRQRGPARKTAPFRQLARLDLALPPRNFHTRRIVDDTARALRIELSVAFEQRSLTTIVSLVREGVAATVTNSPAVGQFWPAGSVLARRIVRPALTRTVYLVRPARRGLTLAAQVVYGIVRRQALDAVSGGLWQGVALA